MTTYAPPAPFDAIALLLQNRSSVQGLLDAYDVLCGRQGDVRSEKLAVVERLSLELTLDTQVEEEVLVPALHRAGIDLSPILALHDCAWALVARMSMGDPGDLRYDGKVQALGRDLCHQLRRAHDETVAALVATDMDLGELGARMVARKVQLMEAVERDEQEDESDDPVGRPVSTRLH
jgi:hypothetical protein